MLTEKKRITNNRYLSKFKTRSIRFTLEDDEKIQKAAAANGDSVQGYILTAVHDRIERDAATLASTGRGDSTGRGANDPTA